MSHKFNRFLSALFCIFLGGMLVLSTVLPDKEFSPMENRYLAKPPKLSVQSLSEGTFMSEAEKYVSDHLAGRDLWVSLKTWCERLSGKQENNGVYFGSRDTLLTRVDAPDPEKLAQDMLSVDKLVSNVDVPVWFGLIPSSAAVWSDRLPKGAPTLDEFPLIQQLYSQTAAQTIDFSSALSAHADEDIYYRTDHHWTSLGAFYGANALFEAMELDPLDLNDFEKTTVTEDFNGTTFSTSGVRWVKPDAIDTYVPEDGIKVTNNFDGTFTPGSLYVPEHLEQKDKYKFFLGGNQPLCIIETEHTDAPKVLVIRDSYSDSLAPFLTQRFSQIHLFDLRYNLNSVQKYVEENDIDQVVVLYSLNNFLTDSHLKQLGR